MGLLRQASCGVANSPRLTISLWAKPPTVGGANYLLQWGHNPPPDHAGATDPGSTANPWPGSFVYVENSSDILGARLAVQVSGIWNDIFGPDYLSSSDPPNDDLYRSLTASDGVEEPDSNSLFTMLTEAEVNHITTEFAGPWFHLLFACDLTNAVNHLSAGNPFVICLNGTVKSLDTIYQPSNAVGPQSVRQGMRSTYYPSQDHLLSEVWPFQITRTDNSVDPPEEIVTTGTMPGTPIAWSGLEVGVPKQAYYAENPPDDLTNLNSVFLANVQVWVDQFIDPRDPANVAKFIKDGRSVKPDISRAAFGAPTFEFIGRRPASGLNNTGSGGDFTRVGTILDGARLP